MKIGVSTMPCGKVNSPRRAEEFESVARIWKDTAGGGSMRETKRGQAQRRRKILPAEISEYFPLHFFQ